MAFLLICKALLNSQRISCFYVTLKLSIFFFLFFNSFYSTDSQYEFRDMFENGNYRRRKRMKRPYRTGAHFSKMYDPYVTNPNNYTSSRTVFPHNSYQTYPRYETQ